MNVPPCSILRAIRTHDPAQRAVTVLATDEHASFGELTFIASVFRRGLARLGLLPGDRLVCALPAGRDFSALLIAAWESGLHLELAPPDRGESSGRLSMPPAKLCVSNQAPSRNLRVRQVSITELGQHASLRAVPEPPDSPDIFELSAMADGCVETVGPIALRRSIENFTACNAVAAGDMLLSGSSHLTLEGAFISTILPLMLGLHVTWAGRLVVNDPARLQTALETADLVELAGPDWLAATALRVPPRARTLLVGSCGLHASETAALAALNRPVQRGFGTTETGFWAVTTGEDAPTGCRFTADIRPLRSPLHLHGVDAAHGSGEIVLHSAAGDGPAQRTGSVGWITPGGAVEIAGKLSDVVVRAGHAFLLSDHDRLLARHPGVRTSRTFRENGASPTEKIVTVCVSDMTEPNLREWLLDHAEISVQPDRIVIVPRDVCTALPALPVLRSVATGQAGKAVAAALTARRFRRNPAYKEAGLVAAVERSLLGGRPLDFLMFWGCGPRATAAAPDRAAVAALAELLSAATEAAPLRAHAHIIFTDAHATNNGHSEAHYTSYFGATANLAKDLDASFELESAVWRRAGLTKARISALEQEPGFLERWEQFPLQSRFVQQAMRHSRLTDKVAAARHYYATCLREREVLQSMFTGSVFLTYNGPEFNECFPDLPTLYVYPGPRGRNDKPWFVDVDEAQHVAAA